MVKNQKIIAQIASLPARVVTLEKTVASLLPQVDFLFVALNGYEEVPAFLKTDKKIVHALMDNTLGDAAKFYDIEERNGYVFTCDDDLVYPSDYVGYMKSKVDEHQCVVSLLGKRYRNRPITSARGGYTALYRCLTAVNGDHEVDTAGTGAMAFHTDHIKVKIDGFERANMADIWMAKQAHEQGVKIIAVGHRARWLKHAFYSRRIWVSSKGQDKYHAEVLNSFLK